MFDLSLEELEGKITELAGHLWAGSSRFLTLLGEFDVREGWAQWGIVSCAHWLSWRCGVGPVAAREQVRVARALRRLPLLAEAFGAGRLSYSKVRALTRIADPATERMLLEWAEVSTAAQLERVVRGVRLAHALEDPARRRRVRSLNWSYDEGGNLVIRGCFDPEDGAVIIAALNDAVKQLDDPAVSGSGHVSAETSLEDDPDEGSTPFERRRADAMTLMAESFLATGVRPMETRPLVVLHVDPATLVDGSGSWNSLEGGPPVSPETARRLACDAEVLRVRDEAGGSSITIGRRSPTVPRAMRRAIRHRDGGCRFPSCLARARVDAHHVVHWAHGGHTSTDNLVQLCRRHHRYVHEHGFRVHALGRGRFAFARPDGTPIEAHASAGDLTCMTAANRAAGHVIDEQTCASRWDGRHPDYGLAVEVFLDRERRARSPADP